MAGRLKSEEKAPEIVKYVMEPFLKGLGAHFDVHLRIHKAHVVMLCEQGLITGDEAQQILAALLELEKSGEEGLHLHANTDLYMQMEAFVVQRTPAAGGKMHMGRSRNDLYACAGRMLNRERLADLISDTLVLQRTILDRGAEHVQTVMPGYTHLQHAEPITLGHYLVAFFDALSRDVVRMANAFDATNLNALGAAALSGSSFRLDRDRTAELLGFRGLVENTYDAVAARDFLVETAAALAILSSTITRVADNLIVWSTSEFSMVDLPDAYGYTSSIMPQKRNPGYFLESLRSKSARVSGHLMSALGTLKGTTFAQSRDTSFEIMVPVLAAFQETTGIVNLMKGVMASLIANQESMRTKCAEEFSGATEIANMMVREKGLDFRSAYRIVAEVVRRTVENRKQPSDVTSGLIDIVASELFGRRIGLPESQLRQALNPAENVELKISVGGPASQEVQRMIRKRSGELDQTTNAHQGRLESLKNADAILNQAIETLVH